MTIYNAAPPTLNAVGQAYNQTRVALFGAPLQDINIEGNVADLCFTAFDAIQRATADRQLCAEQTVEARGRVMMKYILATDIQGVLGHLTYSNESNHLNIQQGLFNMVYTNASGYPEYIVRRPRFSVRAHAILLQASALI